MSVINEPIHDLIDQADDLVEAINQGADPQTIAEQVTRLRAAIRQARATLDPEDTEQDYRQRQHDDVYGAADHLEAQIENDLGDVS